MAVKELEGVGNPHHEWHEWTGRAYHVRRRLSDEEIAVVGQAVDCRGTAEWSARYYACVRHLPDEAKRLAVAEMDR